MGHYRDADPRRTLPNMDIFDGIVSFPLSDIVQMAMATVTPAEWADAILADDEARAVLIEAACSRWRTPSLEDADRRKLLAALGSVVHDEALDKLARSAASMEYAVTRDAHHYDEVRRINETLRELGVTVDRHVRDEDGSYSVKPVALQFDDRGRSKREGNGSWTRGELEVSGRAWEEAREFWRAEVLKRFPAPTSPAEPDHG